MPHTPCRFEVNGVHSLQCFVSDILKDVGVLLSILRRQQEKRIWPFSVQSLQERVLEFVLRA